MPAWVPYLLAATAVLVALCGAAGVWLIWRDHRSLGRALHELRAVVDSLRELSMGLNRVYHNFQQFVNELRWGRGPRP